MQIDMSTRIHRLLLLVVVASTACGDSTEPPEHADLGGSWTYSATYSVNLGALGTVGCSLSGVQVSLSQSGSSISGTGQGGESVCDSPFFPLEPATAENPATILGTVDGNSVSIEVDSFVLLSHEGTVSGNSMSGTVTGTGDIPGGGSISVTGSWSASR